MKTPSCLPVVMMLMLPLLLLIQGLNSACIDREREALLEMKKSFIDKSDCLSSWSGVNCCEWKGVECDGIGHVTQLWLQLPQLNAYGRCYIGNDIPDESVTDGGWLEGEINPSLLKLEYLEQLDLSGNMLSGIIPSNIGSLNHLTRIDLSENNFTGPIPTSIGLLSNLEWLIVAQNHLTGPIPTSVGLLSKLIDLDVSDNSLTGTVSELHFAKHASLEFLYMDSNKLTMNVSHQWNPPFQLFELTIQSCKVGPKFPSWLQTQTSLFKLYLSSTGISDTIPGWFEGILSYIEELDLSKNEIRGKVPEIRNPNSDEYAFVNLNSNKFERLFKQFPPNVSFLDVSNNLLSGQFPPKWDVPIFKDGSLKSFNFANNNLSGPIPDYLCSFEPNFVDLSSNQLSGQLNSCFGSIEALEVLDLSHNNLHGQIPSDFGYGSGGYSLFSLHLSHNRFHGKLPSTLQNFNNLTTLDLYNNAFTGFLPQWLPKLTHLKILNFQLNNFYGEIPETLCKLKHLQLLHLGGNNISGTIPPCFSNFTGMTTNDSLRDPFLSPLENILVFSYFQENLEVAVRGFNRRYTSSLPFLVSMDLSSNNIVGNIPPELMNLLGLKNLNISCNRLEGNIPMRISNLKNLESLDLSQNKLCGVIPSSLSGLTFLSHLNLSFNNLSGRIPTGNQLQTLEDPSIYIGNNQLCGKPLEQKCPGDVNESSEHTRVHSHKVEDDDSFRMWFYAGIGPGFVVGFVGFCSVLYFKNSWRHAFFLFFENGWNWLYVQIAVKTSLLKKKFQKCQTVG